MKLNTITHLLNTWSYDNDDIFKVIGSKVKVTKTFSAEAHLNSSWKGA